VVHPQRHLQRLPAGAVRYLGRRRLGAVQPALRPRRSRPRLLRPVGAPDTSQSRGGTRRGRSPAGGVGSGAGLMFELRNVEAALEAFPALGDRLPQTAGSLSGGEQQMLALARAYLVRPNLVLLDEVSMGLAPRVVDAIFSFVDRLARSGAALLIVEQYVRR